MKHLLILALLSSAAFLILTGCGSIQRYITGITGNLQIKCYQGVRYVQSDSGLAVAVDLNGKPLPCN